MQIVLPGALPDPPEARELTSYLLDAAPTLGRWLQQSRAFQSQSDPALTGCTPYEQWQLGSCGFSPKAGQNLCAGLAALQAYKAMRHHRVPSHTNANDASTDKAAPSATEYTKPGALRSIAREQPIWLVELVHMSPSREGARLLPAGELSITEDQSAALLNSAQKLFEDSGFSLRPLSEEHWLIDIPDDFAPLCASPALVGSTSVNDWWPQDMAARPWRRLVNELQMLWFESTVNQHRYDRGLAPVNSLWLFGGGALDQFTNIEKSCDSCSHVHDTLLAPSLAHDWGGWIAALAELEYRVFKPLALSSPPPGLVLTGSRRIIELKPSTLHMWTRWLPGSRDTWRKWWSPPS